MHPQAYLPWLCCDRGVHVHSGGLETLHCTVALYDTMDAALLVASKVIFGCVEPTPSSLVLATAQLPHRTCPSFYTPTPPYPSGRYVLCFHAVGMWVFYAALSTRRLNPELEQRGFTMFAEAAFTTVSAFANAGWVTAPPSACL